MTNRATHTGINAGELSEGITALAAIRRQSGLDLADIVKAVRGGKNGMCVIDDITILFDRKAEKAFAEVDKSLAEPREIHIKLFATAERVLDDVWHDVGQLKQVEVLGGDGGKCDVRLTGTQGHVPLSLKYGHDAPEKRQTPHWEGLKKAYSRCGLDIDFYENTYTRAYTQFMKGGRRHSAAKGDYTTELRRNCDLVSDTQMSLWEEAAAFIDELFDPQKAAEGIIDMYCGDEKKIYYAAMDTGEVTCIAQPMVRRIADKLRTGKPTMVVTRTSSGRTLKADVFVGSMKVLHMYSTVSTNPKSRTLDSNIRTPKPQTYFVPQIEELLK